MKVAVATIAAIGVLEVFAQGTASARENFLKQQAYAEMQRVSGQVDALQQNHEELERRVAADATARTAQKAEIDALRGEIAALKGVVVELRREMQSLRQEIVSDLTKRISKMTLATTSPAPSAPPSAAARSAQPRTPEPIGSHFEYVVESGDSLFLIAKAFKTTPQKIREANGLKGSNLRVGQKLRVPKE